MAADKRLSVQIPLTALSGAMIPLCFPPYGFWPLWLPSLALLLWSTTGTTARRAFYLGMLHGMLGYGFSLYWLCTIFGTAAVALYGILALFTAAFTLAVNWLSPRIDSAFLQVTLAAVMWTGIEFYRSELFYLRFPWITPGTALGPTHLSPLLGVYATSFVVVAAAAAWLHRKTMGLAVGLSASVVMLGVIRPGVVNVTQDNVNVTLVQCEACSLGTLVDMTRAAAGEEPDLVVWPEYSLPYDVRQDAADWNTLTELCAEMDIVLVVGTKTISGGEAADWRNTALTIDRQGAVGEYYKARPVHFFDDGIPGTEFSPIETNLGHIGTPICFDCDYTDVMREITSDRAELFAVPSCDPSHWSADQHQQHALLFQHRAAENCRWIACAASSGVSQFIDPHGNVRAGLPALETGVMTHRIGRNNEVTPFVRGGWLFPWLMLAATVLAVTVEFVRVRVGKRLSSSPPPAGDRT